MKADVVQCGFAFAITEIYVLKGHIASNRFGQARSRLSGALFSGVDDVEYPFARGSGALEHLIQAVKLANRRIEHVQKKQKTNQFSRCHFAGDGETAADPQHQSKSERSGEA